MAKIKIRGTEDVIQDLKDNQMPFILESTTFTKRIICMQGDFKYCELTDISGKELFFIGMVKNYVTSLDGFPKVKRENITYIKKSVFKNISFSKDLYEVDLSQAYWQEAYKNRFISPEIYERGLTLSKKIRLISLGALAKQTMILPFDGYEFGPMTYEAMHPASNVFFKVSQITDKNLKLAYLTAGRGALFYWCDAIFLKGKQAFNDVKDFFNENKLPFKYFELDRVTFNGNKAIVTSEDYAEKNKGKNKVREFNFEK